MNFNNPILRIIGMILALILSFSAFGFAGGTDVHGGAPMPIPAPPGPQRAIVLTGDAAADFFAEMVYLHRDFYQDPVLKSSECTVSSQGGNSQGAGSINFTNRNTHQVLSENLGTDDAVFLCQALQKAGLKPSQGGNSTGYQTLQTGTIACQGTPVNQCNIWLSP